MTRKTPISHNKIELLHRISLIFLIVFVCASAFCGYVSAYSDDYFDGDGTQDSPYIIKTATDLQNLSINVSNGNNYTGRYFRVDKIINLNTVCSEIYGDWIPIGNNSSFKPFSGNFDGNGKTISNLYINNSSADYQGLFGYAVNANFTNVSLTNVNITGKREVGGLIGYIKVNGGTIRIENCDVTGNVSGQNNVSGLIGWNEVSSGGKSTIENCYAAGDVSGGTLSTFISGLIGSNEVSSDGKSTIENCYAAGDVSGGTTSTFISGLIGGNSASDSGVITIKNCYAVGDVSGTLYTGGLIGVNGAVDTSVITIENCYAAGDVSSGIMITSGLIGGNTVASAKIYVNNSTALNQYVNGTSYVGRIVGNNKKGMLNNNYGWEGMKNKDSFFTENIGLNKINGEDVSNKSVWCNESFFKNTLHWDFTDTWAIVSADDGNCYPLPYLITLGRDGLLRDKVIHLRPNYIVTFNKNTGDGIMDDQIFPSALFQEISPNKFLKGGYKFIGWNNTSSGAKIYDDKQSIRVTKNTTLYAVWAKITNVTLYFNNTTSSSSGSQVVNITNGFDEFNVTQLARPIYKGYTFLGYNNSSNGGSVRVINDTLKLVQNADGYTLNGKWNNTSSDVELWAVWKPNITNVTLNFNNGTLLNKTVNISYGSDQFNESLSPLNYPGYTFLGFFNKSSGGVQVINNALGLAPNAVNYTSDGLWINDTRNIELWAVWEKIPETAPIPTSSGTSSSYYHTTTYIGGINSEVIVEPLCNVYFNSTGGSHVDNQINLHRGDKVTEPKNPTKDGYAFKAWYTVDAYKWDFKNDTVNKSFTLYANWTAIPEHNCCCWFWIILLIIAGTVITAVIIKKVRDKKRDEEV